MYLLFIIIHTAAVVDVVAVVAVVVVAVSYVQEKNFWQRTFL